MRLYCAPCHIGSTIERHGGGACENDGLLKHSVAGQFGGRHLGCQRLDAEDLEHLVVPSESVICDSKGVVVADKMIGHACYARTNGVVEGAVGHLHTVHLLHLMQQTFLFESDGYLGGK